MTYLTHTLYPQGKTSYYNKRGKKKKHLTPTCGGVDHSYTVKLVAASRMTRAR